MKQNKSCWRLALTQMRSAFTDAKFTGCAVKKGHIRLFFRAAREDPRQVVYHPRVEHGQEDSREIFFTQVATGCPSRERREANNFPKRTRLIPENPMMRNKFDCAKNS